MLVNGMRQDIKKTIHNDQLEFNSGIQCYEDIEWDFRKWRDITCFEIGRINIVKMSMPPKCNTESMQCPITYH